MSQGHWDPGVRDVGGQGKGCEQRWKMEAREESGGEEGAREGGWLGRSSGAFGSAGGAPAGLEDGEEGIWADNVVFKWAVIDGLGGEGRILGASQGRGGGTRTPALEAP